LRKNLASDPARGERDAKKPAEPPKAEPAPAPAPPGNPAPKPEAPAPAPVVAAAKEEAKTGALADKDRQAAPKKDAESFGKADDSKAKKATVEAAAAETPPAHLTLASTQMTKARPQVEEALRKLGVALPPPPVGTKAQPRGGQAAENSYALEMTESQIAKLKQEMDKLGYARILAAAPGDQVLAQYGESGIYRARDKAAAAGAAAPPAPTRKPAEKPKDEKSAEDAQAGAKPAEGLEKGAEPRRKVVLHLLEVLAFPDAQPAPDPVKK
jgi:hypothetical protein